MYGVHKRKHYSFKILHRIALLTECYVQQVYTTEPAIHRIKKDILSFHCVDRWTTKIEDDEKRWFIFYFSRDWLYDILNEIEKSEDNWRKQNEQKSDNGMNIMEQVNIFIHLNSLHKKLIVPFLMLLNENVLLLFEILGSILLFRVDKKWKMIINKYKSKITNFVVFSKYLRTNSEEF